MLRQYLEEIGFLPLGRGEIELQRFSIDYVVQHVVFVRLELTIFIVFVDYILIRGSVPLKLCKMKKDTFLVFTSFSISGKLGSR